LITDNG